MNINQARQMRPLKTGFIGNKPTGLDAALALNRSAPDEFEWAVFEHSQETRSMTVSPLVSIQR